MLLDATINIVGYVESKYNILCSTEDGKILLYNSLYKNLIELNSEEYEAIKYGEVDLASDLGKVLIDYKFVVHPAINELEYSFNETVKGINSNKKRGPK